MKITAFWLTGGNIIDNPEIKENILREQKNMVLLRIRTNSIDQIFCSSSLRQ